MNQGGFHLLCLDTVGCQAIGKLFFPFCLVHGYIQSFGDSFTLLLHYSQWVTTMKRQWSGGAIVLGDLKVMKVKI